MVRRVALITILTAVVSPASGVLLLWLGERVVHGIQPRGVEVVDQVDLLRVFIIYALFFTGPLAALFAALGASVLFALAVHGWRRGVLLLLGVVLGAVSGLIAVPPPGYHLVETVIAGPTNPYAVVGIVNGAMWGLVVAAYARRSLLRPRAGTDPG